MNTQIIRNKWTDENISYLKKAYLQGLPLKQIAATLDRSVSAINKALARHKLRTHRKSSLFTSLPHPTAHQLQQRRNLGTQIRKRNKKKKTNVWSGYREWTLFERVLNWMRAEGICVFKSKFDAYYEIDGYPKTKAQILYIANLRREGLQLPVFFVKGITYS